MTTNSNDLPRVLHTAAWIWLAYLLALACIDWYLYNYHFEPVIRLFYLVNGGIALLFLVLSHWTLPDSLASAVNMHQSPNPGEGDVASIARILNASDRIAELLCEVPKGDRVAAVCLEATGFARLEPSVLGALMPTIESDIEELADSLRIDVIASSVYSLVAKFVQEAVNAPVAQ